MISVRGTLFYSHPLNATARQNGWIKFSVDGGDSWWLWRQVEPAGFAYSSLTLLAADATHVSLGLAYEDEAMEDHAKGSLRWTTLTDFFPRVPTAQRGDGRGPQHLRADVIEPVIDPPS